VAEGGGKFRKYGLGWLLSFYRDGKVFNLNMKSQSRSNISGYDQKLFCLKTYLREVFFYRSVNEACPPPLGYQKLFCLKALGNHCCPGVAGRAGSSPATGSYQGVMEDRTPSNIPIPVSNISFKVVNEIISDFTVSGGNLGEFSLLDFETGTGNVINDLTLEILFVNSTSPSVTYEIVLRRTFKN